MPDSDLWKRQMTWAWFVAEEHRLHDREFRRDALECAREMMRLARQNVRLIVDRLFEQGYRFAFPNEAYVPPRDNPAEVLDAIEEKGGFVPISLRAWIEEVGEVNLMGSHPDWTSPAYLFPQASTPATVWCTDPLVVKTTPDLIRGEYTDWFGLRKSAGADAAGRFRITIAPDEIHKANMSGGAPYQIPGDRPAVDTLVLNERRCVSFVAYLRYCFDWGGFPGFAYIDDAPRPFIKLLREGLQKF